MSDSAAFTSLIALSLVSLCLVGAWLWVVFDLSRKRHAAWRQQFREWMQLLK